jgi:hypothetical protein
MEMSRRETISLDLDKSKDQNRLFLLALVKDTNSIGTSIPILGL